MESSFPKTLYEINIEYIILEEHRKYIKNEKEENFIYIGNCFFYLFMSGGKRI